MDEHCEEKSGSHDIEADEGREIRHLRNPKFFEIFNFISSLPYLKNDAVHFILIKNFSFEIYRLKTHRSYR